MHTQKILNIASPDINLKDNFSKELGISKILAQILVNRGIKNLKEAHEFLDVSPKYLLDPYQFSDMHKAVNLIDKARKNKEKVMIFGDYDVDGITALALLKDTLAKAGLQVMHYLPHRIKEGYGLNKDIVNIAHNNNIKLLITVDCGITNHKEIQALRQKGIEVIITDHHEPQTETLPSACAIINPKVKNSNYKYRDLAGAGVAYKLCQAFSNQLLLEDLDLVSLGTIADSVPLTGENRVIAKEGLVRLSQTKREGLKILIENAGIQNKKFTSTYVSFILAPRLNASGRMDSAETSLNLLMSNSKEEAGKFASVIEGYNRSRQKIEGKILEEAQDLIDREINFKENKIIVLAKEDWHHGVLGIVASKIADRFYRPAIVISVGDDLCKGSARSIKNFHLFDALLDCKEFLNTFGGHSHAAGLVIAKDNIEGFKQNINRLARERLNLTDLIPSLDIDMELNLSDLNEEIITELEKLEPFGTGNPEPLFYSRGLKLKGEPQTLSRETLKFWVSDGDITFQAIGFGMSDLKKSLMRADCFDLIYSPRIDNWRGDSAILLEAKEMFFR